MNCYPLTIILKLKKLSARQGKTTPKSNLPQAKKGPIKSQYESLWWVPAVAHCCSLSLFAGLPEFVNHGGQVLSRSLLLNVVSPRLSSFQLPLWFRVDPFYLNLTLTQLTTPLSVTDFQPTCNKLAENISSR